MLGLTPRRRRHHQPPSRRMQGGTKAAGRGPHRSPFPQRQPPQAPPRRRLRQQQLRCQRPQAMRTGQPPQGGWRRWRGTCASAPQQAQGPRQRRRLPCSRLRQRLRMLTRGQHSKVDLTRGRLQGCRAQCNDAERSLARRLLVRLRHAPAAAFPLLPPPFFVGGAAAVAGVAFAPAEARPVLQVPRWRMAWLGAAASPGPGVTSGLGARTAPASLSPPEQGRQTSAQIGEASRRTTSPL